jgi:hypothetical protein
MSRKGREESGKERDSCWERERPRAEFFVARRSAGGQNGDCGLFIRRPERGKSSVLRRKRTELDEGDYWIMRAMRPMRPRESREAMGTLHHEVCDTRARLVIATRVDALSLHSWIP